jgi:hypothetical protein
MLLYEGMSVIESILEDLKDLPTAKLVEVACYVHALNPKGQERRHAALRATAGSMAGEQGEEFERAVRGEADRIDGDSG